MQEKDPSHLPLLVKLCTDKAAFEARPLRNLRLDLNEANRRLAQSKQYKFVVSTPHLLIFKGERAEITLSRDCRMIIKRVTTEAEAKEIANQILDLIL